MSTGSSPELQRRLSSPVGIFILCMKILGGYILLARQILENSSWHALNEAGKVVMVTLLMLANHRDKKWYNPLTKEQIFIKRGQCIIGRKSLAKKCGVGERSVRTALTLLKTTSFLTIQTTNRFSIITICNYEPYQNPKNYTDQVSDQQSDQPPTSRRPAADQPPTTTNNDNNVKNDKNDKNVIEDILSDLNLVLKTSYKPSSLKTKELIQARLNEGFTLDDFKAVHRNMAKRWGADNKMREFLRPITLYSNKFESYLNIKQELPISTEGAKAIMAGKSWLEKEEKKTDVAKG